MSRLLFVLAGSSLILAACETTAPAPTTSESTAVSVIQEAEAAPNPEFVFAMDTVSKLLDAGNTPTAIDRLTQLIGSPNLSDKERAEAIYMRGQLRYSPDGFNVWGAIEDFEEVLKTYPDHIDTAEAQAALDTARGEATSLNFNLETGNLGRAERFSARFRLGEYVDAIDYMTSVNLTPRNDELLAMYYIGYLCDAEDLTGRTYDMKAPDGSALTLRFCDFGK
ncbi:MAG: hypothetical protein AAFX02_02295 [Pseudomonadota bacterium]